MNYNLIKELATELGCKVTDLLALAAKNDPFYQGTPAVVQRGEWFAEIYNRAGFSPARPAHLRRVHYWLTTNRTPTIMPDGKPYRNTDQCWQFIVEAGKAARYLGLVPMDGVIDNKNPNPHESAIYTPGVEPGYSLHIPNLEKPHVWIDGITVAGAQPYHLEIWIEKSTMNDVLLPVAQRYGANLVTFEGEVSITSVCVNLMRRIEAGDNKPTRIVYVSDFDPAGNSMPVGMSRKLEYAVHQSGLDLDIRVRSLALTAAQVEQYQLPRIPIKETETRAGKFEAAFGSGAVELDALEALYPNLLARIVGDALKPYYSRAAAQAVEDAEDALRQAVQERVEAITARYQEHIDALESMFDELRKVEGEIDASEYAVDRFEADADEDDSDWLFDSQRDYIEQIRYYKAHKGQEAELF